MADQEEQERYKENLALLLCFEAVTITGSTERCKWHMCHCGVCILVVMATVFHPQDFLSCVATNLILAED